ncbi:MAG: hypothetical protein H6673_03255 [Anaerolineales bacterium]|nr:hypothetical protein [Anaerolineales bacterium]
MARELRNLTQVIFLGFLLIIISSAYWSVLQHEGLLQRKDNPRRVFADQHFARGLIVDRHGIALAITSPRAGTTYPQRNYPYPEVVSATGYYSYQYGVDGLELAFNDVLVGEWGPSPRAWEVWKNELLSRPSVGADLRSTMDVWLQLAVVDAFAERSGAAVVVELPSGAIRALVSLPAVNPNTLDLNWTHLQANHKQQSPLVNRVLNVSYQPGSVLQPLILMAMLNDGYRLEQPIALSQSPIYIDGFTLTCMQSASDSLTLRDAFILGCPEPFADYDLDPILFADAGFFESVPLSRIPNAAYPPIKMRDVKLEALGQGQLTVTPLQMARVTVAIANEGRVPDFYLADAYRMPSERVWRSLAIPHHTTQLFPLEWVAPMREVMAESAAQMPIEAGVYGHAGVAYAGHQMLSWYLGFSTESGGLTWVVVVVVEDAQAPYDAVAVAQGAFDYLATLEE